MASCSLISREEKEFGLEEAERRKNRRRRGDLRPRKKLSDCVPQPNHEQLQRGKEKIPLANFDIYPKKELPKDKHIRISKKLPSPYRPSCERPSKQNNRDIQIKGEPQCLEGSRFRPRFQSELSRYFRRQEKVCSVKDLCNFVWCEGPFIRSKTRYATWNHANFFAELEYDDGTTSKKHYFAEVIDFERESGPGTFKVTACVPIDQNMNVVAENSLKCVICDCERICHPSSELCIADVSSLNPYMFKEWINICRQVYIPFVLSTNTYNCLKQSNQLGHPSSDNNCLKQMNQFGNPGSDHNCLKQWNQFDHLQLGSLYC